MIYAADRAHTDNITPDRGIENGCHITHRTVKRTALNFAHHILIIIRTVAHYTSIDRIRVNITQTTERTVTDFALTDRANDCANFSQTALT